MPPGSRSEEPIPFDRSTPGGDSSDRDDGAGAIDARYRGIFEEAGVGIVLGDPTGRIVEANPAIEQLLGYSSAELRGRHFREITHPDDIASDELLFDELLAGERDRYRIEKRYLRKDGTSIWARLTVSLVRGDETPFRYAIGVIEDITDEHVAARALRASDARARRQLAEIESIYDHAPVGLCVLDRDLRFLRINERLAEMNGLAADEHLGRTIREVVPTVADEAEPVMRRVLETGDPVRGIEIQGETEARPGEIRHWVENYYPIAENGRVVGLNVVVEEITDRKRAEAQLRQAKERAERASRAKSEFLAVVSHELRTPLTAVLGYAHLLDVEAAGALNDEQRDYVGRIDRSARHLGDVIDEILHVIELEAGRETLHTAWIDVSELARDVAAVFLPAAREKGLTLRTDLPDPPVRIRTDPGKLREVLVSLLSNAVKFTAEGGVELSVRSGPHGAVRIDVRDTGPGIPPEARQRIFERFGIGADARTREHGGLGLGLAIAAQLTRLLGGEITVESDVGRGSTFTVALPRVPPRVDRSR